MAYYLDSINTSFRSVTIPVVEFLGDFEVEVVAARLLSSSGGTFIFAGNGTTGGNGLDLYRNASGNYQVFINASSAITTTAPVTNNITVPDTVIIKRIAGVVEILVNGVSRGTVSNSSTLKIERLFHRNGWANYARMGLYKFTIVSGGSYNTSWNESNAPSTGNTWVSTNGQLITQPVNWPADNSEWVFYDDGGTPVAEDTTTTGSLVTKIALNGLSNSAETLITASNQTTSGSLISQAVLTALNSYTETLLVPDVKSSTGVLTTVVSLLGPNTYTQLNDRNTTGILISRVVLSALNSSQETLLNPENKTSTSSLAVTVGLLGLSSHTSTAVGVDSQSTSANLNTRIFGNFSSAQTIVLNKESTMSLVTLVKLNAVSQALDLALVTENKSSIGYVQTTVAYTADSSFYENTGEGWDLPTVLFNEPREIKEIALTFDQLGRPVVFYRVNTDDLYLYWFNAITQQNEIKFVSKGKNPVAGFDIIDDTSDATSDVMLFYVKDDTVFMRIQREDYNVEHNTGVVLPGILLKSSGMRIDNRFQVIYGYEGQPQIEVTPGNPGGIQPPDPEPPIDPTDPGLPDNQTPIDGRYVYKNAGYSSGNCMVANSVKINCRDTFSLGYTIDLIGPGQLYGSPNEVDPYNRWHHMFGLDSIAGSSNHIMCIMKHHKLDQRVMFTLWIGANGYTYSLELFNMPSVLGDWKFEFSNGNKVKVYFNGELKDEDFSTNPGYVLDRTRLTFGGYRYIQENTATGSLPGNGSSFDGALSNCWVDHPNYGRIDWPIVIENGKLQQSVPGGYPLEFTNYRDKNWVLIKE